MSRKGGRSFSLPQQQKSCVGWVYVRRRGELELELELIQPHMAQKPMLRGEVGARALRVRSDVRGHGQVRLCKALGCGRCGCLKPIRACCVVGSAFFLVAPPRGGCAMAPRDSGMCLGGFQIQKFRNRGDGVFGGS